MSKHGRIPDDTVQLLSRLTEQVRREVLPALEGAPARVEAATMEAVLDVVLRDWRENNNTSGLLAPDILDLRSFIQLARELAGPEPFGSGEAIYLSMLKAMLEDWLKNWNEPGKPGPPDRS